MEAGFRWLTRWNTAEQLRSIAPTSSMIIRRWPVQEKYNFLWYAFDKVEDMVRDLRELDEPPPLQKESRFWGVPCDSQRLSGDCSSKEWLSQTRAAEIKRPNDGATLKIKEKAPVQAWRMKINMNLSAERQEMICSHGKASLANFRWGNNLFCENANCCSLRPAIHLSAFSNNGSF